MFDSCSFTHQFKLNYEETKKVAIGHVVSSGEISAGEHLWKIMCNPRGDREENKGEYLSIYRYHASKSKNAKAIFEVFVMDRDSAPSSSHRKRFVQFYTPKDNWGWPKFVERSVLKSLYLTDGSFIVMCGVKVIPDNPLDDAPPSDIGSHLGVLLDSEDGSDVSFVVDGEEFPAHRAVLAARSPVFKAQLLGSMADAKMASITLHDIAPATFKAMLRFIYTDAFPVEGGFEDSQAEKLQDLLAAADR
ncbi:hypothetical protein PVAP13_6NG299000 [Panicum virgatum]|uniref:Uncharacterized protein n=1 Tax=Panicum virgatum TaxID=38727 RepID=A0A8T0R337_PANVG|nr:hypothetical protein PVAP13_6NG299000 [Panicum virgatum]